MFARMLLWLVAAFVGAVLVRFVGELTKTEIKSRSFANDVAFRIVFVLYSYFIIEALLWALS